MADRTTFLGIPSYNGMVSAETACALINHGERRVKLTIGRNSLLAFNFNDLLCTAWELHRREGITHFAMLHADVGPVEDGWLAKMHEMLRVNDLDLLSVALPIKDIAGLRGETSIAECSASTVGKVMAEHRGFRASDTFSRLTVQQIAFNGTNGVLVSSKLRCLLVNTGLMIARIEALPLPQMAFAINDAVLPLGENWEPSCLSEDWQMSIKLWQAGARYGATAAIRAKHVGSFAWPNWGAADA